MQFNPYLSFNKQCEQAFKFYEQALGGHITFMMTWGEAPNAAEMPPEMHALIMHATLTVNDAVLMGADAPHEHYKPPRGLCVSIHLEKVAEGQRIFTALAQGGLIQMPFQQTFWSPGFGMCIDQFGIPWMVNCEA